MTDWNFIDDPFRLGTSVVHDDTKKNCILSTNVPALDSYINKSEIKWTVCLLDIVTSWTNRIILKNSKEHEEMVKIIDRFNVVHS